VGQPRQRGVIQMREAMIEFPMIYEEATTPTVGRARFPCFEAGDIQGSLYNASRSSVPRRLDKITGRL
jgi:hypothetical protein